MSKAEDRQKCAEYRKKREALEKQKGSAQDEAMNMLVGAPIQSEQQMPIQDGG